MTTEERNQLIMEKIDQGMSLSDLQTLLNKEYGQHFTYFELRMLAADLQVNWTKLDKPKAPAAPQPPAAPVSPSPLASDETNEGEPADEMGRMRNGETFQEEEFNADSQAMEGTPAEKAEEAPQGNGQCLVSIHDTPLQGTAISGDVVFPSGIKARWFMDRMGQLGLAAPEGADPQAEQQEPSEEDFLAFQKTLKDVMKKHSEEVMAKAFDGRTQVEISPIVKAGCRMNGTVTFASGAKGEWLVGERGLEIIPDEGSAEPTVEDKTYFQLVLQKAIQEKGMM